MKLRDLKPGDIFRVGKIIGDEEYTTYFDYALYDEKLDNRRATILLISDRYGIRRIKVGLSKEISNIQGDKLFWYGKAFKAIFNGKYGYSDMVRN